MRQHYAKKISYGKKIRRKKTVSFFSWQVIFAVMLGAGIIFLIWRLYVVSHHPKSALHIFSFYQKKSIPTKKKSSPPIEVSNNTIEFDFYDALPKGNLTLDVKQSPILRPNSPNSPNSPSMTNALRYFLILGEFSKHSNAAQTRLSLLLAGIDSSIIQKNLNNHIVWQIRKGPFLTEKLAHNEWIRLKNKGIESRIDKNNIAPI